MAPGCEINLLDGIGIEDFCLVQHVKRSTEWNRLAKHSRRLRELLADHFVTHRWNHGHTLLLQSLQIACQVRMIEVFIDIANYHPVSFTTAGLPDVVVELSGSVYE